MRESPLAMLIRRTCEDARLRDMFENVSRDDSFFGPYDCADIHMWMNMQGDGAYCAV